MKKLLTMISLVFLGFGLTACATTSPYEAYVTIDINPSVGFIVNEKNVIQETYALNADGEMLLSGLSLQQKSLDTAVEEIIDTAMDLGFIDVEADSTTIQVDAIGDTESIGNKVRKLTQDKIQSKMNERALQANVQNRQYSEAEQAEAGNLGLTPGQYRLMKQALETDPELTETEACEQKPEALMQRMREHQETKDIAHAIRDEFHAAKQAIHDEYIPQIQALEAQIKAAQANTEDTTELEAQLLALKEAMHTQMMAVVDQFQADSLAYRNAMAEQRQNRIQEHHDAVMAHRQNMMNKTTNRYGNKK